MNNDKKMFLNLRRRLYPRIYDFSFIVCRSHINTFKIFTETLNHNTSSEPTILDIGCGTKPLQSLFPKWNYFGIDINTESHADFILDCNKDTFPLPDGTIDGIILSNSLEHIFNTNHLLNEIRRVLKPNGLIYFSVPMTFPVHAHPDDYHRFTPYCIKRLFSDCEILCLNLTNSLFSTPVILCSQILETLFPIVLTCIPITFLNFFALLLDSSTKHLFSLLGFEILKRTWSGCPIELNGIIKYSIPSKSC